jgi:hypothetical protein
MEVSSELLDWLSQGTAIAVLAGVGWFIAFRAWPYFCERDAQERERRYDLALRDNRTEEAIALSLSKIEYGLTNPIAVVLVEPDEHYQKVYLDRPEKQE